MGASGQTAAGLDEPLASWPLQRLLATRVCDLPLFRTAGGAPPPLPKAMRDGLERLRAELDMAGLKHLRPRFYLGGEWFCPDGLTEIALPFWLTHPRLRALERRMIGDVEGAGPVHFMRLLRHEAGHAFDHAYGLNRTAAYRQIFGARTGRYHPDVYLPDPASRDHVRNLPGFYAQSDPDEDFAETFAVCVDPGSDWRRRYQKWPGAMHKLEFVRELINRHGPEPVRRGATASEECYAAARMRMTLARFYERRRAERRTYDLWNLRLRGKSLPADDRHHSGIK